MSTNPPSSPWRKDFQSLSALPLNTHPRLAIFHLPISYWFMPVFSSTQALCYHSCVRGLRVHLYVLSSFSVLNETSGIEFSIRKTICSFSQGYPGKKSVWSVPGFTWLLWYSQTVSTGKFSTVLSVPLRSGLVQTLWWYWHFLPNKSLNTPRSLILTFSVSVNVCTKLLKRWSLLSKLV